MTGQNPSMKMSRQELRKLADFREMAEAHIERLGQAIMRRRKALGWSRAKLGRETNAHEKTVERWEKAQTAGALDNLEAIASALDTEPDDLLAESMERAKPVGAPDVLGALNGDPTERLARIEEVLEQVQASQVELLAAVGEIQHDLQAQPSPRKRDAGGAAASNS